MIISRSVFNKISKVVFSTTEPSSTLVLWGKPSDPYYDFYIYEAGTWQYVAGVQEESGEVVPLPNIPSKLSEYTNDVGFITEVDLADYLEEHGFTPGGGGGGGTSSWDDIEDKPIKVAGFSAIDVTRNSLYPETIAAITALKNSGIALGDLVLVNYDNTSTTSATVATVSSVSPFRMTFFCRDKFVSLSEAPENVYSSNVIDLSTLYPLSIDGIPYEDLDSSVQASLNNADSALQSYTETDPIFIASAAYSITSTDITNWNSKTGNIGTITGITMNGTSKGTSGVVDLGTVITAHQDISGKVDKTTTVNGKDLSSNITLTASDVNALPSSTVIPAAQVNADWNASSGISQILNKPTIPDAVSGVNDGTNWTSITIGSTTKAIPSGGGGEANVIESISINGTTQIVTSKNVDLPVPTSTAVTQIVSISQSAYDALSTKDSSTLYLITS